jgi:hypothetical protein
MNFKVREYGRTELALCYCPDITGEAAWRKLKKWIDRFPGLPESLLEHGYDGSQRSFTPKQVDIIVKALGEP